ncbi:hypothetical protein GPECTOR_3g48 [Gonium pectorale]|uniref:Uncharacterized protein n=1 Tax=Gonium pectorale TaxID=33097 RepID=A0A150GZR1_GONPE|nr:hypothetical protein GPECTOR_3g48 [Gonium pectorale]|eukprot:KXZ55349.1 hypothetical protein GPECTOR_3g48 [Gonium pectorale]
MEVGLTAAPASVTIVGGGPKVVVVVGPREGTCPDCGPCCGADAAALAGYPCGLSEAGRTAYTTRHLCGNLLNAAVRFDLSVWAYLATALPALLLLLARPAAYTRWRHALVSGHRLAMVAGNVLAALLAPPACIPATTALYYMPSYRPWRPALAAAAGGTGPGANAALYSGWELVCNMGLLFVAARALTISKLLLYAILPAALMAAQEASQRRAFRSVRGS